MQYMHATRTCTQLEPGLPVPCSPLLPSWITGQRQTLMTIPNKQEALFHQPGSQPRLSLPPLVKKRLKCCLSWESVCVRVSTLFLLVDFNSLPGVLSGPWTSWSHLCLKSMWKSFSVWGSPERLSHWFPFPQFSVVWFYPLKQPLVFDV